MYWISWIQACKTADKLYSETSPTERVLWSKTWNEALFVNAVRIHTALTDLNVAFYTMVVFILHLQITTDGAKHRIFIHRIA